MANAASQIVQQPPAPLTRHPPPLRASLTANAVLQRPTAVADEHFLEQNPWANPQHPAHLHRQTSAISRTASPLATPALNKRPVKALGQNSASTVAEAQSGLNSSIGPTPAAGQQDRDLQFAKQRFNNARRERGPPSSTPSKLPPALRQSLTLPAENQQSRLQRNKASPLTTPDRKNPPMAERDQMQEIHMRPYVPRVSLKADSPSSGSTSKLPTSTSPSSQYPIIKAEDFARLSGRSPTPQQHHRPVSINGTVNGMGHQFVAS